MDRAAVGSVVEMKDAAEVQRRVPAEDPEAGGRLQGTRRAGRVAAARGSVLLAAVDGMQQSRPTDRLAAHAARGARPVSTSMASLVVVPGVRRRWLTRPTQADEREPWRRRGQA